MTTKTKIHDASKISDYIVQTQAKEIARLESAIRQTRRLLLSRNDDYQRRALETLNSALNATPGRERSAMSSERRVLASYLAETGSSKMFG